MSWEDAVVTKKQSTCSVMQIPLSLVTCCHLIDNVADRPCGHAAVIRPRGSSPFTLVELFLTHATSVEAFRIVKDKDDALPPTLFGFAQTDAVGPHGQSNNVRKTRSPLRGLGEEPWGRIATSMAVQQ